MDHFKKNFIIQKDQINHHPSEVGKEVYKILSKEQNSVTVGEVLRESEKRFVETMEATIHDNMGKYELPFYIVVLTKKESWTLNVMRNWFMARQTKPSSGILRHDYPNHQQTVYCFHNRGTPPIEILWSLPIAQDCKVILDNPHLYDPHLVTWILEHRQGLYNSPALQSV